MEKDIRVLIIEDDPYARDMMAMLLARDWRTRVEGEVHSLASARSFIEGNLQPIDVAVLDTEITTSPTWAFDIAAELQSLPKAPKMLFTATQIDAGKLKRIVSGDFSGYLIKSEVLYSLATAISLCHQGDWVATPSVLEAIPDLTQAVKKTVAVVDGTKPVALFTPRETEIIRLGLMFNLTHRDVADELVVSPIWVSEVISRAYEKLGLREMVNGDIRIDDIFEDRSVANRIRGLLNRSATSSGGSQLRKTAWVSTLAFHMLTVPEVETHFHHPP